MNNKSVVVTCPYSKEPIRLMPGSRALELFELARGPNGKKGTKQKPSFMDQYVAHMTETHKKWLKEIGRA